MRPPNRVASSSRADGRSRAPTRLSGGYTPCVDISCNTGIMCGRYSLIADISELQARFDFQGVKSKFMPSFNVAPTQQVLTVVAQDGARTGQYMRWGLIPPWAKDARIGSRMINARAETVTEKPSFRSTLRRRRCLVLADGFYEWQKVGAYKRPMRIVMKSGDLFAFAGLWESWKDLSGEAVRSCTIITTSSQRSAKAHTPPDARHPTQGPGRILAGQRGSGAVFPVPGASVLPGQRAGRLRGFYAG